jgi:predicted nucleotidyltransferase
MDAQPLLAEVLYAMRLYRLEGILIGNAAAALHGAPVTTLDFDFMFRETPVNLRKLKDVSRTLDAVILRPYYPVSKLYRMVNDDLGLQVDFMPVIHGVRSFESLRSRTTTITIVGYELRLAALKDIIASKRAAGRPRDRAVLEILERTLETQRQASSAPAEGRPRRPHRGK